MRNRFEQYKKTYVVFVDVLLMVYAICIFGVIWMNQINVLQSTDFKNKGNWLMLVVYMVILIAFFAVFQAFKIGYYTLSSILISQSLAYFCTHIIVAVQIILIIGEVKHIPEILVAVFHMLVLNWLGGGILTIVFTKIYNRILPPYHMLQIYGDYPNQLKQKVSMRADKYSVDEDIYIGEPIEVIKEKMDKYDAVILNDIPSNMKNVLLKYCFGKGIRVYFVPKISDILVQGADEINLFDTPLLLNKNVGLTWGQRFIKRCIDIVISAVVLILTSPFMLLAALAIKMEDRGSIFYSQKRCTIHGREFMVHKFRSMRVDAEKVGGAQLAKKDDDRITKVGKFIRKTRIDELPQLINVLSGQMSFVWPRPERPEFIEENCKNIPEFEYRMQVKAGLTGYAQVYGKYTTTFLDKLKLDLIYIQKYSILLDLQIIMMTLKVVLMKESAEGLVEEKSDEISNLEDSSIE